MRAGLDEVKRAVQVGMRVDENFVTTASFFPVDKASPPKKSEFVELCHERVVAVLKLRTANEILPAGVTATTIPSLTPLFACLAIVSELLPRRRREPSLLLESAFNSVSDLPTSIGLPNVPFKSD